LNFDGKSRDVSTIAHEFGHAIHSMTARVKEDELIDLCIG
jgi:oligoendopeptidase F